MRKDIFIFAAGAVLTALAVKYATAALLWNIVFWAGITAMVFSAAGVGLRKLNASAKWRVGTYGALGIVMVGVILFVYFPRDKAIPGFTGYSVIKLYDTPESRRRYVFELVSSDGAKVSFYLSASSVFTLAATDLRGESYPLEVRVGGDGIPIDQFVALFCEIGISENSTMMRVLVNEKEVARRDLAFALDLGKMDWKPGALGAPVIGTNQGGVFLLGEFGVYPFTMTSSQVHALVDNIRGYYKQPFN